jgi:hypothetical protein
MLLVIPVSHVDLDRAVQMARRIVSYGDMGEEFVLVSSTWNAAWDVDELMRILRPAFAGVGLHKLESECELGWPESANHLFYETMRFVSEAGFLDSVYFMEADNVALRPGWFAALKNEYAEAGKPYMGVINDSKWFTKTGEVEIRGRHMVGTGIYPRDFFETCQSIHTIGRIPWDVEIGPEVIRDCRDTKLIAHRWGTKNYRRENGVIVMDDIDPIHGYAKPIPPQAMIVHGAKDGSLDRLLSDEGA